jgi:Tc5 transposase DNA-binding domain
MPRAQNPPENVSPYMETEAHLQEAVEYKRQHPNIPYRWLETQFRVNKDRIQRRWKGTHQSKSDRDPTNQRLEEHQERALSWYLTRLWEIGVPLRQKLIAAAATEILTTAHPDDNFPSLGERWAARWLDRHSEFQVQREKSIEIERQRAMNAAQIQDFFTKYHDAVNNYKIEKCDVWNMDETGLRVGIGRGQWVVVPTRRPIQKFNWISR